MPLHHSELKENEYGKYIIRMKSNYDELKDVSMKNRTCFYFNDITKIEWFNFGNILLDKKSYGNILVYCTSCKTFNGAKPMHISFDEVDGFVRVYDWNIYLQ